MSFAPNTLAPLFDIKMKKIFKELKKLKDDFNDVGISNPSHPLHSIKNKRYRQIQIRNTKSIWTNEFCALRTDG